MTDPQPQEESTQAEAPPSNPEIDQLRAERDAARKRVDELARAVQAMDRDKEEFKQRLSRERERLIDVEKGNVALALVEAVDELDLVLTADPAAQTSLGQGVKLIRDNLLKKLQAAGVERLALEGLPYDPGSAEAVDMELTAEEADDQKVVQVIRAGYRLKDRVIRPARVKVAKYVKPADA